MIWRLLFLAAALVLAIGLAARSWFGAGVRRRIGGQSCTVYRNEWQRVLGQEPGLTAWECGEQIRISAMQEWREQDEAEWKKRGAVVRFGQIAPPMSIVIGVLGAAVRRMPVFGAISLVLAVTAIATVMALASANAELRAVNRWLRQGRRDGLFLHEEDFQYAAICARAAVWQHMLPTILGR